MPESPLAALVQGYTEAQELKMKKAREIANQQADKFEREYKLSQAKQQAAYQAQQVEMEGRRITIEKQQADIRAKAEAETERKNKQVEAISKFKSEQQAGHWLRQEQLGDAKGIQAAALKGQGEYMKKFPEMTSDAALNAAIEDIYITRNRMVPQGLAPHQPEQQGQTAQQPGQGNPLAQMMQQMQGQQGQAGGPPLTQIIPPGEGSDARHMASPVLQEALALQQAKTKATKALEDERQAQTHVLNITADATKALKSAEATEHAEKAKTAAVQARQALDKGQAEIAHIRALSAVELEQANNLRSEITTRSGNLAISRAKMDMELKDPVKRNKGIIDLQGKVAVWNSDQAKLQKQVGSEIDQISKLHVILDPGVMEAVKDPKTGKPLYDVPTIAVTRRGAAEQMAHHLAMKDSLVVKINELQGFVDNAQSALLDTKALQVTTPGGRPDTRATGAAKRAADTSAKKHELRAKDKPITPYDPTKDTGARLDPITGGLAGVTPRSSKPAAKKKPATKRRFIGDYGGYKVYEGK